MRRAAALATSLALVLLAAGCGDGDEPVVAGDGAATATRYTASATVLESPGHGPQLCLGGVMESYPPQCGGPDVVGWDWDDVDDEEAADGTTWTSATVVGMWDGERLTLTEPPEPPEVGAGSGPDLSTPCPEPPGGWAVVDPARTTMAAQEAALAHARAEPGFAGAWVDQSINPASQGGAVDPEAMNDPERLVLDLRFTGDLERHEAEVRALWGGALCITRADRSLDELLAIRDELQDELQGDAALLHAAVDEVHGVVEIGVVVTDSALQASLDERDGEGTVVVIGALRPVG
jgi:hypothetical protein